MIPGCIWDIPDASPVKARPGQGIRKSQLSCRKRLSFAFVLCFHAQHRLRKADWTVRANLHLSGTAAASRSDPAGEGAPTPAGIICLSALPVSSSLFQFLKVRGIRKLHSDCLTRVHKVNVEIHFHFVALLLTGACERRRNGDLEHTAVLNPGDDIAI